MSDTRPSEVLEDIAAHCEPTSEIDPKYVLWYFPAGHV
jgi:hypothetical protein